MSAELLSQQVYDWLLRRILSHDLKPGDRINRRDVADQCDVSVAPTLEAMVQLEWEGFLETRPRMGTRVRVVEAEEVRGQFILREALETQGARMYCGASVRDSKEELFRLARAVDRSNPSTTRNWRLEIDFHCGLMKLTDCKVLIETFDHVMRHSLFYAMNELLPPPRKKRIPDSHSRLVKALQVNDPDKAETIIREHIRSRWLDRENNSKAS